ncbi:hypothetical protein BC832DRAFT_290932 [Gaertneriomyces semiglobifer]|nr:hypothetical protein BC832DRAFT_290932 [Gaertneriomyces semiglobifer]
MSFPIHLSPVHTERDTYTYAPPSLILQQTYAERPLHMMFPQLNFFSHNRFKSLFEAGVFKDCTMATAFELLCKEPYLDQPTLFTLSAHQYASRFEDAVLFLAREYGSACKNTLKRAAYRMLKRWSESKNDFVQHYLQRCSEARLGDKAWTFAGAVRTFYCLSITSKALMMLWTV